jgi:hypothetical protein
VVGVVNFRFIYVVLTEGLSDKMAALKEMRKQVIWISRRILQEEGTEFEAILKC